MSTNEINHIKDDIDHLNESSYNIYYYPIILLTLISLSIFYIYISKNKKSISKKKDKILICGPNSTGKTTFFYSLISNKSPLTVSSMEVNEYKDFEITSSSSNSQESIKNTFHLIDIPGIGYFKDYLIERITSSKAILIFLDSSDRKSLIEVSEFIYDILNEESLDDSTKIFIVCNKSDSKFAKGRDVIESELTNEVEAKKVMKQKNTLEEQTKVGNLFSLKAKFSFKAYDNVCFVESTKDNEFKDLKELIRSKVVM